MNKYINAADWSYDSTVTQSRLINISDILSYFNGLYGKNKSVDQMIEKLEIDLINMPHVYFADVKRGEWIEKNYGGYNWNFMCSECGYLDGFPMKERMNFCPNCGADMRERIEKNDRR